MATYKLVLTVKDNYGKEKEIDGGTVDIDLADLSAEDITIVTDALNLEDYATDIELADAIKKIPTIETIKETIKTDVPIVLEKDTEVHQVLTEVVERHVDTIKYSSFDAPIEEDI